MNGYFPSIYASPVATQYRMTLTIGEHTPRHIRRIVRAFLTDWNMEHLTEAAELAATELTTNVFRHVPDRRCTFLLRKQRNGVRLEVTDAYTQLPAKPAESPPDAEGGRGLLLLTAMTDKWGVKPTPTGGKRVWCELTADQENQTSGSKVTVTNSPSCATTRSGC
ncbi:ATP-binding protein [Streptomyces antibioticus]|nr:ATP-binding protein [Streptomyces antibioticus]